MRVYVHAWGALLINHTREMMTLLVSICLNKHTHIHTGSMTCMLSVQQHKRCRREQQLRFSFYHLQLPGYHHHQREGLLVVCRCSVGSGCLVQLSLASTFPRIFDKNASTGCSWGLLLSLRFQTQTVREIVKIATKKKEVISVQ
jgi:hypothetical protein